MVKQLTYILETKDGKLDLIIIYPEQKRAIIRSLNILRDVSEENLKKAIKILSILTKTKDFKIEKDPLGFYYIEYS